MTDQGTTYNTSCPFCGVATSRTVHPFIDIVEDPLLYDAMQTGLLFEFVCPRCGSEKIMPHSCVYKDSEENFFLYFVEDEAKEHIAEKSSKMAYKRRSGRKLPQMRFVETPGQLCEKALIMSAGYDDRIMEIVKMVFEREAEKTKNTKYVTSLIVDLPPEGFRIVLIDEKGNYYNTVIDEYVYDQIEEQVTDTPAFKGRGLLEIDRAWAESILDGTETGANNPTGEVFLRIQLGDDDEYNLFEDDEEDDNETEPNKNIDDENNQIELTENKDILEESMQAEAENIPVATEDVSLSQNQSDRDEILKTRGDSQQVKLPPRRPPMRFPTDQTSPSQQVPNQVTSLPPVQNQQPSQPQSRFGIQSADDVLAPTWGDTTIDNSMFSEEDLSEEEKQMYKQMMENNEDDD